MLHYFSKKTNLIVIQNLVLSSTYLLFGDCFWQCWLHSYREDEEKEKGKANEKFTFIKCESAKVCGRDAGMQQNTAIKIETQHVFQFLWQYVLVALIKQMSE